MWSKRTLLGNVTENVLTEKAWENVVEGLGNVVGRLFVTQTFISVDEIPWCHQTTPFGTVYFLGFYQTKVDFLFCGEGGGGGGGGCSERVEVTLYLLTSIFLCSEQRCLHRCWFCFLLYQFWNVSLLTNKNDYIIVHSRKYHNIP